MNIAEQIAALEATRKEKAARMEEVAQKSLDDGRSMDDAEAEEFDTIKGEVDRLDADLKRMRELERMKKAADVADLATAAPVTAEAIQKGAQPFEGQALATGAVAKNTQKLDKGIAFARAAKCLALGHLEHRNATEIAKSLYKGQDGVIAAADRLVTKAAVAAADSSTSAWAGNLVGDETSAFADFVEYLRPMTVIGKFGQGGVPSLRSVPFRTALIGQTSGGDGYWVGEGNGKPLTKFDFSRTTLEPLKVANIAVATMEVIRDSSPNADVIIRDQLAAALGARLDTDFVDPDKSASSGVSPASILNGATNSASSGNDADAVRADIKTLFGNFIASNNTPSTGVWIMPSTVALALSLMQNPLGQPEFAGLSMNGGTLYGLPVITSEYVPTDTSGSVVALVNAGDIYVGDEGGIDLSMSTEASLQMDSAPDNPTDASTVMVSLWQRNLVGFLAERTINWKRRRDSSVAYLTAVNWGAASA